MRFIKAVKIFDGERYFPSGTVIILDTSNRIADVTNDIEIPPDKIEHFDGILTPGFINSHCHLELSHLKSVVSKGKGFTEFAIDLMAKRSKFNGEQISEAMVLAEMQMVNNGIVAVGDISNNDSSIKIKQEKKLYYHTFVELIGLNPESAKSVFEKGELLTKQMRGEGLDCSLAPHAPYSVSVELIKLIAEENLRRGLPLSIHNQESVEEHLFFMGQKSRIHELYEHLNINIDFFSPPQTSSLCNYLSSLKGDKNILVHNTFTPPDDIRSGQKKRVFWCFCPGANLYIENRLPEFERFMNQPEQVCIGTDSLASNGQLDVLAELNILAEHTPGLNDEQLLSMVCANGARALGIDRVYGKLLKDRRPGLNLVKKNGSKFELTKMIS